jgi:hypothetical protein
MAYGSVRTPLTQQRPENFMDDLSNSGLAIRLCDDGKATGARPKTVRGEVTTQYLVAIYHCPLHTISRAGSANLVQTLMKHDLVDEFWLKIYPLTLGSGKLLFVDGTIPAAFKVTASTVSPNGIIIVNYERAGAIRTGSY